MQGTRFAIRMVAVAVAAALAQGVAAEDYEDENYLHDSDHSYDSFKVTDSDQTDYYAVCVWRSSSLTVNQAFSVSTERKSDVDKQLLGVYVEANSTLEVKGGADISVINSSNLAANNNYIFGLQTEDKIILGGVMI